MHPYSIPIGTHVSFVVPPVVDKAVIRDFAGGLGFEVNSGYILPPLDLLQLSACIEAQFSVSVIDGQAQHLTATDLVNRLKKQLPSLAIVQFSIPTLARDLDCARQICEAGILVVGRINTTEVSLLKQILSSGAVQYCITGECEDNLSSILQGTDRKGTAYLEAGEVIVVPKELIEDLDKLPFPLRKLVVNRYWYPKLGDCTTMLSSRGCPYPCGYYCPYPMTQGKRWRGRSADSIIAEMLQIEKLGVSRVLFRDPVFTLCAERVLNICSGLHKANLKFQWWCETRADLLNNHLLEAMATAGCIGINVGVESGDADLRHSQLKRGLSNNILISVCAKARQVGIKIAFLLMVGFPGETRKSILATAQLVSKCRPFSIGVSFPVHHPGTKFERDARTQGWILVDDYLATDGSIPVVAGSGLNSQEMLQAKQMLLELFDYVSSSEHPHQQELNYLKEIETWSSR